MYLHINGGMQNLTTRDISFVIAAGNEIELKNCEIEDRSDYIVFSVCDSGIGIPQEKMETIFEAFRQADGSTSRNYGGTGLGLSISLELSRLLGGMVHLQSEEGKGSQFSLLLPLKFQKMSPAPIVEKTYTINPNSKTVLIIEDDELFAGICADLAEKKGFKAIVASSGERGLDLAKEHLPSAIILDIKLPKMDGYSVLEKLQETKEIAGIPVHVISGVNDETRAIQLGAVEFLKKPVSTASLQSIFHSIENATGDVIEDLLLIMDKSDVYEEVQALLKGTGQKHFHASNEKDALKILEEQAIRCLIIDLDSSSIAPEAFLKAASENKAFKLPPVVVLSEQELSGEQVRSLEKYAEGIIIRNSTVQKNHLDRLSLFIHQVASKKKKSDSKVKATLNNTELLEGKAILLVDDDPRNSYALATRLEQHGMIVHQAFNGQEAIELILKEASIDLTLMDIMMPIMDGYEAMGKIRAKDFPRSKMPIIALTAKAMKEDRDLCLDAGADDYLAKPIDFDKLISLIQVWVQKDEG